MMDPRAATGIAALIPKINPPLIERSACAPTRVAAAAGSTVRPVHLSIVIHYSSHTKASHAHDYC
jgi:hypothetical protein